MSASGWKCPECGRVYAPWVRECEGHPALKWPSIPVRPQIPDGNDTGSPPFWRCFRGWSDVHGVECPGGGAMTTLPLAVLDAELIRLTETGWTLVTDLSEARGVTLVCPAGRSHSHVLYFADRGVPADHPAQLSGRWQVTGTGLHDLSFVGPGAASVLMPSSVAGTASSATGRRCSREPVREPPLVSPRWSCSRSRVAPRGRVYVTEEED